MCMCGPAYVDIWPLLPDVCMHQVAASALVELHRASMQEGAAFEVRGVPGSSSHSMSHKHGQNTPFPPDWIPPPRTYTHGQNNPFPPRENPVADVIWPRSCVIRVQIPAEVGRAALARPPLTRQASTHPPGLHSPARPTLTRQASPLTT